MSPSILGARLLAALAAAVLLASGCADTFRSPAAVVNGTEITDGELRDTIPQYRFLSALRQAPCAQPQSGETAEAACARFTLAQLIESELVAAFARTHDVTVPGDQVTNAIVNLEQQIGGHEALGQQLAGQGITFADLRLLAARLLLVQRVAVVVAGTVVPDLELRQRYEQERLQFTRIHVAHILVKNKSLAVRIAAQATPRNFADLARRYSQDPGSASRGGDLGVNQASGLDPTFVQAALTLQPGQIGGPVHTQLGWHVIYLISVDVAPFDRVRDRLLGEVAQQAFIAWLQEQAKNGDIDVNPRYGRFDPTAGRVEEITCTAATPGPSCSASGSA